MRRLRVLKVIVQPVCVVDDGDSLVEVPVDPVSLTAEQWATFDLDGALDPIRAQVEGPPAEVRAAE